MELPQNIEGVLFYKATPVKKTALCKLFEITETELTDALTALTQQLQGSALQLIQTDTEVQLSTKPELDTLLETVRKDEIRRDIGKAGAETLAIVLYKGPITRAEIDRIRGVNSSFILRNLLVRGLVEKVTEGTQNKFVATAMLLAHLGVANKLELPNYAKTLDALESFEKEQLQEEAVSYE